jgi:hypothetical protein
MNWLLAGWGSCRLQAGSFFDCFRNTIWNMVSTREWPGIFLRRCDGLRTWCRPRNIEALGSRVASGDGWNKGI